MEPCLGQAKDKVRRCRELVWELICRKWMNFSQTERSKLKEACKSTTKTGKHGNIMDLKKQLKRASSEEDVSSNPLVERNRDLLTESHSSNVTISSLPTHQFEMKHMKIVCVQ